MIVEKGSILGEALQGWGWGAPESPAALLPFQPPPHPAQFPASDVGVEADVGKCSEVLHEPELRFKPEQHW